MKASKPFLKSLPANSAVDNAAVKLFPSLLGVSFDTLPASVQLAHGGRSVCLRGQSTITRGTGWLSRICAFFARLPPAQANVETQVDIEVKSDGSECWHRRFGQAHMPGMLSVGPHGWLRERLGAVRFDFLLAAELNGFRWHVKQVAVFGLPLPASWFSAVHAYSYSEAGSYRFLVHAQIPLAGLLVRYEGSLEPHS